MDLEAQNYCIENGLDHYLLTLNLSHLHPFCAYLRTLLRNGSLRIRMSLLMRLSVILLLKIFDEHSVFKVLKIGVL